MKNTEYLIINVYTQANGEKIAVSMLHKTKKGYCEQIKPTAAVEKYGKIEGEINSFWGKLPVVLVPVEQFAALKKEYEIIEYRGPVECTRIRESKPRPDAMALKLYKAFAADAAAPQVDAYITIDGYRFPSGAGEYMLKALKREYNFTKSDIAAADALTLDNAATDATEQPAAPVVDAPADATEQPAAPLVQAAKETGHLIVCSVPKAEQPAAPVVDAPAVDAVTPSNQKTDTPTIKKPKQYADYYGAIVEVLEAGNEKETTLIKIKGGAMLRVENYSLKPTTAKKTTLPDWLKVDGMFKEGESTFTITRVGSRNFDAYETNGNGCYCDAAINSLLHQLSQPNYNGNLIIPLPPCPVDDAPVADTLTVTAEQPAALTDADVLAAAARIKENYEAMKQQAAADAYADAITAYCAALDEPAAPAWAPEVITITPCPAWDDMPAADAAPAPRRRRLNIAPRLSRWLHHARWVAVAFFMCLLSGLLLGMNTSTAADADAAAGDIAAVTDAPTTPSPVKKLAAPSPVKKLATPSPVKKAAADAVTLPGQKTASALATATAPAAADADSLTTAPAANGLQPTPPDGLTICAGTAWAYTMMQWA